MSVTQLKRLLIVVICLEFVVLAGCHRSYYRRQADAEAQRLVLEKANDPRWDSSDGSIEIDPYSRMFNPFSADHPPLPTDDPASHRFMHRVDGRRGYPHWHANGDTRYIENPEWKSYLPTNERGEVVLTLDRAYQLALMHSPEYQAQLETLYLSALDVSLERFGFDTQLFAGFNSFLQHQGNQRTGLGSSRTQQINQLGPFGGGISMQRLGTTGANYVVGIANTILFNISGPSSRSANTLIDFSVIQPLLRNAGRDRVMESLTLAERGLLANVRQMDRFRRGFYLQVATGRFPGAGANRSGNFLGQPNAAPSGVGGFYDLLVQQKQIRNQEFNIRQLEGVVEQFRELFNAGLLDAFQLQFLEGNAFNQQRNLVATRVIYEAALDRFIQSLGLPPDLNVVIEDDFLDQFDLISEEVTNRLIEIDDLTDRVGDATADLVRMLPERFPTEQEISEILALAEDPAIQEDELAMRMVNEQLWAIEAAESFQASQEMSDKLADLVPLLRDAMELIDSVQQRDVGLFRKDMDKLNQVRDSREQYLRDLTAAIDRGELQAVLDPSLYSPESIPASEVLMDRLEGTISEGDRSVIGRLTSSQRDLQQIIELIEQLSDADANLDPRELYNRIKNDISEAIPSKFSMVGGAILDLGLIQAKARANSIEIINVDLRSEQALEIARCFRRDWMNARATLVDIWRSIEFVADQLESQFDLVLQGDMGTTGSNPLRLDYRNGQIRAGLRFDSPIVRLFERNIYRETLVRYQQARRQLYQFEDEVNRNLRDIIRRLNQNKLLFELNRRQIDNQIAQIENSFFQLEAPPDTRPGEAPRNLLGDAAARNLIDAINNLNGIQNQTINTWIQYEVLRRHLDFDMGTMQLDEFGAWTDPGVIDSEYGIRVAQIMGIELDCEFCSNLPMGDRLTSLDDFSTPLETGGTTSPLAPEQILPLEAPQSNWNGSPDDSRLPLEPILEPQPEIPNRSSLPQLPDF